MLNKEIEIQDVIENLRGRFDETLKKSKVDPGYAIEHEWASISRQEFNVVVEAIAPEEPEELGCSFDIFYDDLGKVL